MQGVASPGSNDQLSKISGSKIEGQGGAGPKWVNSICVELRRQYPCPLALKCTPYIDGGRSGLFITWSSKWFLNSYCLITYPPINHCIAWPSNLYSLLASLIYIDETAD